MKRHDWTAAYNRYRNTSKACADKLEIHLAFVISFSFISF